MLSVCTQPCKTAIPLRLLASVGLIFGIATLVSGGKVLFGGDAERLAAGVYVRFVVWFNFLAGFAYILAALGLLVRARWAVWLAAAIAGATVVVSGAFAVHVFTGGAYELRTVGALALRSGVWLLVACVARRTLYAAT